MYKIIILGPPASGKGTQAEFLAEKLKIPIISMGQMLRDESEKGTMLGKEIASYTDKGALVPNSISNELVKQKLSQLDCQKGFIFDGFPRIRIQAKYLDTLTDVNHVLLIAVSDKEVKRRLSGRRTCSQCGDVYHLEFNPPKKAGLCDKCGGQLELRADDTETAIRERLKIYHEETEEVVEYYRQQGILIEINGEQSIEKVRDEIFSILF